MDNRTQSLGLQSTTERVESITDRLPDLALGNPFAAKVLAASRVCCSCEEFNVWHANADKAPAHLPWGELVDEK